MKKLLILITIMLVGGCATPLTPEQKALRDSVVGEYKVEHEDRTWSLLENGIGYYYINGKKYEREWKWSISFGEIHLVSDSGTIEVHRINGDKSITKIAEVVDGKRIYKPKDEQYFFKKIK